MLDRRKRTCRTCGKSHCVWCGRAFVISRDHAHLNPSRDHLPANANRSAGDPYLVLAACRQCNSRRGADDTWVTYHRWSVVRGGVVAPVPHAQWHYLTMVIGVTVALRR